MCNLAHSSYFTDAWLQGAKDSREQGERPLGGLGASGAQVGAELTLGMASMGARTGQSLVRTHPTEAEVQLRAQLERLAPALIGYPVQDLMALYADAEPRESTRAFELLEVCVGAWIAALDLIISSYPANRGDAVGRVLAKQRDTREALAQVRAALAGLRVVRPEGEQVC